MAETTIYIQESTNVQQKGMICTLLCNKLCNSLVFSKTYSNYGLCSSTCNMLYNQLTDNQLPVSTSKSQQDQFQHNLYLSQNLTNPYEIIPIGISNKISIKISYRDKSQTSFIIATDFSLLYGKWTEDTNQCKETPISNKKINHNETIMIHACGREISPTGVEGSILLNS